AAAPLGAGQRPPRSGPQQGAHTTTGGRMTPFSHQPDGLHPNDFVENAGLLRSSQVVTGEHYPKVLRCLKGKPGIATSRSWTCPPCLQKTPPLCGPTSP